MIEQEKQQLTENETGHGKGSGGSIKGAGEQIAL